MSYRRKTTSVLCPEIAIATPSELQDSPEPLNVRNQFGIAPVNVMDEIAVCVPTTKLTVTP